MAIPVICTNHNIKKKRILFLCCIFVKNYFLQNRNNYENIFVGYIKSIIIWFGILKKKLCFNFKYGNLKEEQIHFK
jgi:hypothetical protein